MDAGTDFGGHYRDHAATATAVNEYHAGCISVASFHWPVIILEWGVQIRY
jgi:hypothetical protein